MGKLLQIGRKMGLLLAVVMLITLAGKACYAHETTENPQQFSSETAAHALVGEYTIGGSSADYQNVDIAVAHLRKYGVKGAVTFSIAEGEWESNIQLPYIYGVSEMNTITFRGKKNKTILKTSTEDAVVRLSGAKYLYFENLVLENYEGQAVLLESGCTHNVFRNCRFVGLKAKSVVVLDGTEVANSYNSFYYNAFVGGVRGACVMGGTQTKDHSNAFAWNHFEENQQAVMLAQQSEFIFAHNQLSNHKEQQLADLASSDSQHVYDNRVADEQLGITLDADQMVGNELGNIAAGDEIENTAYCNISSGEEFLTSSVLVSQMGNSSTIVSERTKTNFFRTVQRSVSPMNGGVSEKYSNLRGFNVGVFAGHVAETSVVNGGLEVICDCCDLCKTVGNAPKFEDETDEYTESSFSNVVGVVEKRMRISDNSHEGRIGNVRLQNRGLKTPFIGIGKIANNLEKRIWKSFNEIEKLHRFTYSDIEVCKNLNSLYEEDFLKQGNSGFDNLNLSKQKHGNIFVSKHDGVLMCWVDKESYIFKYLDLSENNKLLNLDNCMCGYIEDSDCCDRNRIEAWRCVDIFTSRSAVVRENDIDTYKEVSICSWGESFEYLGWSSPKYCERDDGWCWEYKFPSDFVGTLCSKNCEADLSCIAANGCSNDLVGFWNQRGKTLYLQNELFKEWEGPPDKWSSHDLDLPLSISLCSVVGNSTENKRFISAFLWVA